MEEVVSTPKLPPPVFRAGIVPPNKEQLLSSSPGFGTPAYPIASRQPRNPAPALAQQSNTTTSQSILPIILPPQTLRPVAFRTLTKKHNLTLTSPGLVLLATFIGKFCGSGWREDGLAERLLDEIAKQWKRDNGGIIIDDGVDKKLKTLLKSFEACMLGGRLDTGRLSRTNSIVGSLSRQNSDLRPDLTRGESQSSLGVSGLDISDNTDIDEEVTSRQDARSYLKVISAFQQPRLKFSTLKKMLEPVSESASLLPPIEHKIAMQRNRFHLVHQRLLRNSSFQTPSFATSFGTPKLMHSGSTSTIQQAYKITSVANLLGRSGTSHLLLGLLVNSAAGDLALADLTSSVVLDTSVARAVPEDGSWFCPGMFVLVEGTYEEDGSNNSNLGAAGGVGGQIKGRFVAETIAGPPAEKREITLGSAHDLKFEKINVSGAGFGWVDFLGVGSEKALGTRMRKIQKAVLSENAHDPEADGKRTKTVIIAECHLDNPQTFEAIRAILSSYVSTNDNADLPVAIVLMGNFVSAASMAGSAKGGGSIEYKEQFDTLASMLSEFAALLAVTTLIFVPGDNDPWASSFSTGAATPLPRQSIPDLFNSRIRRAVTSANAEAGGQQVQCPGESIWTSNPARMSLFGPVDEIVLFRDDVSGRLQRNALSFAKVEGQEDGAINHDSNNDDIEIPAAEPSDELDEAVHVATSHLPRTSEKLQQSASSIAARKLVKTILDQGHLSPFPTTMRPVLWDYASSLNLYPLPTAVVLADAEAPAFAITYEGCHVMNPGRLLDDLGMRKGVAKWMEYDIRSKKGIARDVRF